MTTQTSQNQSLKRTNLAAWLSSHWLEIFLVVYGAWVFVPFIAPLFMHIGWEGAGKTIYFIYSFFCHQLPERSYFFFGQKRMYSLVEIQSVWQNTNNPLILRKFIGNPSVGWKIAWSDRMISFYTSVWFFAVLWIPFRKRIKALSLWGFALLLLPMAVDGITHTISDLSGIGLGFRDTNQWLAVLTHRTFPASFLVGDAIGSFNSWVRLITGLLAGLGIVWLAFPYLSQTQTLTNELERYSYEKVIGQIKNQNHTGG